MGAVNTVHDRFQYWQKQDVFKRMWEAGLQAYDESKGIDWIWQAVDGAMIKAPLGKKERDLTRRIAARDETKFMDEWTRHTVGRRRGWSESSRDETAGAHAV